MAALLAKVSNEMRVTREGNCESRRIRDRIEDATATPRDMHGIAANLSRHVAHDNGQEKVRVANSSRRGPWCKIDTKLAIAQFQHG